MTGSRGSSLTCLPRFATPRNPDRLTRGGEVAKVAEALGSPLMPWQRHVADVAMEVDPATERLAYRELVLTVPRQSGKTTLMLAMAVHRALMMGSAQNIVYTAQTRIDARKKWEDDHVSTLNQSLFAGQYRVRKGAGTEAIIWNNGSHHSIASTTEKAGHGSTLDLGFIDEAFAQVDARVEQAMAPATITRPQPQIVICSTAGTATSIYLNGKIEKGRERVEAGGVSSAAFFEWSAGDGVDLSDSQMWPTFMPAIGYTQTVAAVAGQLDSMELPEFARAYGNRLAVADSFDPVIPVETWAALCDKDSRIVGPVVFGLDVTPSRSSASIVAVGVNDEGRAHIELVDHQPGVAWLLPRLAELVEKWSPAAITLDRLGQSGSLIADLERFDVPVDVSAWRDMSTACGQFFDAATTDNLRHVGQAPLTLALNGAVQRELGDAWAWSRKHSSVDITPLVAATLALWAHKARAAAPTGVSLAFI